MASSRIASRETLSVYRGLLRSVQQVFRGDLDMLVAARQEIRGRIEDAREVREKEALEQLQAEGREAAEFIKTSIMQSIPNDMGHLEVELQDTHADAIIEPIVPGMDLPRERSKKDKTKK